MSNPARLAHVTRNVLAHKEMAKRGLTSACANTPIVGMMPDADNVVRFGATPMAPVSSRVAVSTRFKRRLVALERQFPGLRRLEKPAGRYTATSISSMWGVGAGTTSPCIRMPSTWNSMASRMS